MVKLFEVETGYVVTLASLRAICNDLSVGKARFWIESANRTHVVVGYNYPESTEELPNSLLYRVPVIARIPLLKEDGVLACIHPSAVALVQRALYIEDEEIRADISTDWDAFWTPFSKELIRRLRRVP